MLKLNLDNGNSAYYKNNQFVGNNAFEDINYLNINPPTWPHDDVEIVGNKKALLLLKKAIDHCLEGNVDVSTETVDTNGEGYILIVKLRDMSKENKEYEYDLESEAESDELIAWDDIKRES